MDSEEFVKDYSLERINDFLKLYNSFGNTNPSITDVLLGVINDNFLSFRNIKSDFVVPKEELLDFLKLTDLVRQLLFSVNKDVRR
ncbi:p10 [Diodia vein chlorosis virus]|uniref:p10 n=1 Tax=Diodia vein chlorosis virus TaxID=656520 RepID=E7BKK1_9CLOS|nr:p10 [Diodia vein chlorosis virus]ADU25037.1 p10 [Diodia vein chlorosis virus]